MKALIITDGTESIQSIALLIKDELFSKKPDCQIKVCPAQNFEGSEILPVDIFFLGCEEPSPVSFNFLEQLLSHINLASRKCCVFSVNKKASDYLLNLVKDCEADTIAAFTSENAQAADIKNWLKDI